MKSKWKSSGEIFREADSHDPHVGAVAHFRFRERETLSKARGLSLAIIQFPRSFSRLPERRGNAPRSAALEFTFHAL